MKGRQLKFEKANSLGNFEKESSLAIIRDLFRANKSSD